MKDYEKHWFEVYYQFSPGKHYLSKVLIARNELDAVDLMYTLYPDAIVWDIHKIGKSSDKIQYPDCKAESEVIK